MDEHKNIEQTSAAAPSGDGVEAAAPPPSMIPPPSESVIELACIESPALAPSIAETAAGSHSKAEPKSEGKPEPEPKPAGKRAFTSATAFDEIMPKGTRHPSGRATGDMIVIPAIAAQRSAPRFGRITLLAVAIVAALGAGAIAGALGAAGVARLMPAAATVAAAPAPEQLQTLHGAIAQLRTEVAALKTSIDANNRNANAQFAKLTDRIEHAQADAAAKPTKTSDALEHRPDQVAAKDVTGSVTLPQTASAAPVPPPMPQPAIVPGWILRDVYRGNAILQGRMGAMVEVAPGDMLPGLGRIESIRRQDGRWIVLTSRGIITSMQ